MLKRIYNIILFSFLYSTLYCQTGGDNVYEFLNLTHSGLVSSLGGSNVSLTGRNLNLAWHNPALLSSVMDKSLALNYVNYLAGINYGLAMYSFSIPEKGNFAGGITYLNYGAFTEADASGNITGSFSASEYAFSAIWSLELDSAFTVGVNFNPVLSHLEKYTSFGFAFDLGAAWHNQANLFSAGIVFRNIGLQVTTYAGEPGGKLPFEILAGASAKLAHAPFRFSLTVRHLEKFDLTYNYPESSGEGSTNSTGSGFFENVMRHAIFGAEIIPHRNFYLAIGYNYQRRRELQTEGKVSGVGFSWGFGFNTSMLSLEFGRASYHLAGSSNHISLVIYPKLIKSAFSKSY
ncbi:MAG: type IX secretion system protein PorQ [Bacteroidota bacterium]|nr:type IX secretion system protein PorQ [Bacteroidota bacterium]